MTTLPSRPELNFEQLDRELSRTKTQVFKQKNAAFFGSLMCSLRFRWTEEVPTAATDGVEIMWNPYYFYYLKPNGRQSILVHEIRHVALLHMLRRGNRDPKVWNAACDTVLDNQMLKEGYCVDGSLFPIEAGFPPGSKTFVNPDYDGWTAEAIYDDMMKNPPPPSGACSMPGFGTGDLLEPGKGVNAPTQHQIVNKVVAAMQAATIAGVKAGDLPGEIETTLSQFLKPKLPWKQILFNFFNDLSNHDYSWSRPNRRYSDVYLPSLLPDHEGLEHLAYFEDVSGSITDQQALRFNSEFKYVKETFEPEKMTMVQFDTKIQKIDVFEKDDPFDEIKIVGRGGTSLICVRDWIIENRPTAAVIFSDLECRPMQPLPADCQIPIIWVAINNRGAKVPHGTLIHLRED